MLDSGTDLLIGVPGTILYLYLWNRVLGAGRPADDLPEAEVAKRKWRHRSWQLFFFVAMTPYVLFLFLVMERVRSLFQDAPDLTDVPQ